MLAFYILYGYFEEKRLGLPPYPGKCKVSKSEGGGLMQPGNIKNRYFEKKSSKYDLESYSHFPLFIALYWVWWREKNMCTKIAYPPDPKYMASYKKE